MEEEYWENIHPLQRSSLVHTLMKLGIFDMSEVFVGTVDTQNLQFHQQPFGGII